MNTITKLPNNNDWVIIPPNEYQETYEALHYEDFDNFVLDARKILRASTYEDIVGILTNPYNKLLQHNEQIFLFENNEYKLIELEVKENN